MATYKVIQDIEAEDHILGPLTLRQFIYALVACFGIYMCFIGLTKHFLPLVVIFLPVVLLAGFFAFPFGKDQPTEVWALAKIRFLFMPRKRIWDQSGIKELVTVTAPKKIEHAFTNGLSQTEVKSRLRALADTIDSRGWAIKNVNVSMYGQASPVTTVDSDRLIDPSTMPQAVPDFEITASDDILDEQSNPIAQQFTQMINTSTQQHRQQLLAQMHSATAATQPAIAPTPARPSAPQPPADYWFLNQPAAPAQLPPDAAIFQSQVVAPGASDVPVIAASSDVTPEEAAVIARAKQQSTTQAVSYAHLKTIQPLGSAPLPPPPTPPVAPAPATSAPAPDPAILKLANNNDLNVATLAREAKRATKPDDEGEVVISLH